MAEVLPWHIESSQCRYQWTIKDGPSLLGVFISTPEDQGRRGYTLSFVRVAIAGQSDPLALEGTRLLLSATDEKAVADFAQQLLDERAVSGDRPGSRRWTSREARAMPIDGAHVRKLPADVGLDIVGERGGMGRTAIYRGGVPIVVDLLRLFAARTAPERVTIEADDLVTAEEIEGLALGCRSRDSDSAVKSWLSQASRRHLTLHSRVPDRWGSEVRIWLADDGVIIDRWEDRAISRGSSRLTARPAEGTEIAFVESTSPGLTVSILGKTDDRKSAKTTQRSLFNQHSTDRDDRAAFEHVARFVVPTVQLGGEHLPDLVDRIEEAVSLLAFQRALRGDDPAPASTPTAGGVLVPKAVSGEVRRLLSERSIARAFSVTVPMRR